MFKLLFRHRGKAATMEQKLATQRDMEKQRKLETRRELAMRANIAHKLKSYNAQEDTSISNFSLSEEVVERKLSSRPAPPRGGDVWGQANPRETGHWNKENRVARDRKPGRKS